MQKDWRQAVTIGDEDWVRSILDHSKEEAALRETINSKDQHGQTGLMVASIYGHTEVVRLLVEQGAELNHTAKFNLSALMLAVINRHAEIVSILVNAGADREIRGSDGKNSAPGFSGLTALALAEKAGHDEIADLLR